MVWIIYNLYFQKNNFIYCKLIELPNKNFLYLGIVYLAREDIINKLEIDVIVNCADDCNVLYPNIDLDLNNLI